MEEKDWFRKADSQSTKILKNNYKKLHYQFHRKPLMGKLTKDLPSID